MTEFELDENMIKGGDDGVPMGKRVLVDVDSPEIRRMRWRGAVLVSVEVALYQRTPEEENEITKDPEEK